MERSAHQGRAVADDGASTSIAGRAAIGTLSSDNGRLHFMPPVLRRRTPRRRSAGLRGCERARLDPCCSPTAHRCCRGRQKLLHFASWPGRAAQRGRSIAIPPSPTTLSVGATPARVAPYGSIDWLCVLLRRPSIFGSLLAARRALPLRAFGMSVPTARVYGSAQHVVPTWHRIRLGGRARRVGMDHPRRGRDPPHTRRRPTRLRAHAGPARALPVGQRDQLVCERSSILPHEA